MKLPKIIFEYSMIYDRVIQESLGKKYTEKKYEQTINLLKNAQNKWKKIERKVLTNISLVTKLEWVQNEITIYFVYDFPVVSLSRPLTIRLVKNPRYMENMIHELIHEILHPYLRGSKDARLKIFKKSPGIHVPVILVERMVYEKVFGKQTANSRMKFLRSLKKEKSLPAIEFADKVYPSFVGSNKNILDFLKIQDKWKP